MKKIEVQAAAEVSFVVRKGTVSVPKGTGIEMEAFHAPLFQYNILTVGMLTRHFNINFTMDPSAINYISTCIISVRSTGKKVSFFEIDADRLYGTKAGDENIFTDVHALPS